MAAFDTTRSTYGAAGTSGRIGQIFVSLFSAVAAWNDARQTRNLLGKLSDRELEDIGLSRADIDRVANDQ